MSLSRTSIVTILVSIGFITIFSLAGAGVQRGLARPPVQTCFVSLNDSGTTDYSGGDASVLQTAIDSAAAGDLLKIAGTCENINAASSVLNIQKSLTIRGGYTETNWTTSDPNTNPTTINGLDTGRVIKVSAGLTSTVGSLEVTIDSLNITQGAAFGALSAGAGGGINLSGGVSVTLMNSTVTGNEAYTGGGIFNLGSLTILDSTIDGNESRQSGGGIYNDVSGHITVLKSTLSNNLSGVDGGGIQNLGVLTLTNNTLSDNLALFLGGGINNTNAMTVTNSTFYGNQATTNGGGGIQNGGTLQLDNALIAGSKTGGDCVGTAAGGNNLIEDGANACGLVNGVDGNVIGQGDPILAPLADNGGPTLTHAVLAGSPAIDNADAGKCPAVDQRGFLRPDGSGCDIGSFEYSHPDICFVNNNGTLFSSSDASALQDAVNAAVSGDFLKVAGVCGGVGIGKSLTIQGGYTVTNWTTSDPLLHPTTLDAQYTSRVIDAGGLAHVTLDNLHLKRGIIPRLLDPTGFNNGDAPDIGPDDWGGGIFNSGVLTLTHVTLSDSIGTIGGGIYNNGSRARLTIIDSTLISNSVSFYGGGIYNDLGTILMINSTLSGNMSDAYGGAISNSGGNLTLINSTLSDNKGASGEGGISSSGLLTLYNTLIVNSIGGDCSISGGQVVGGNNLIEDSGPQACGLVNGVDGNIIGQGDPQLAPLADNGGPTLTYALLHRSAAIDSGDLAHCPATDQRGVKRPIGSGCDIGAYERPHQLIFPLIAAGD